LNQAGGGILLDAMTLKMFRTLALFGALTLEIVQVVLTFYRRKVGDDFKILFHK
jgi:hypothetical protein